MRGMIRLFNRLSFRQKLVITYAIIAVLSTVIVGGVFTGITRGILLDQAQEQSVSSVDGLRVRLQQIIGRVNDVSDELYMNKALEKIAATVYASPQQAFDEYAAFDEFNRILHVSPEIRRITVYINNDTLLENGQFMRLSEAVMQTEMYAQAQAQHGSIVWRCEESRAEGTTLHLSRMIITNERQTIGMLDIELSTSYLHALLRSERNATVLMINGQPFASSQAVAGQEEYAAAEDTWTEEGSRVVVEGTPYLHVGGRFYGPASAEWNEFGISILVPEAAIFASANDITQRGLLICLIALGVSFLFLLLFSMLFSRRIRILRREMHRVVDGDFEEYAVIDGEDEIAHLYRDLGNIRHSFKTMLAAKEAEQAVREGLLVKQQQIEMKLLSNQINPHFLFNTLETIRMKAHAAGVGDIAQAVKMLARMMRVKMSLQEQTVPMQVEIDIVRDYLDLQRFRYEDRVRYAVEVEDRALAARVLPLLIQPIVENAFLHGLEDKLEGGEIHIRVWVDGELLRVEVSDDGVGIDEQRLTGIEENLAEGRDEGSFGLGLKNVHDRIRMFYGPAYGMALASRQGQGTTVSLTMPYGEESNAYGTTH